MTLTKATREQVRLRILLAGYPGAGKSFSALTLGSELASRCGGRLAVLDTEGGAINLYADRFDFDQARLDDQTPEGYVRGMDAVAAAGYPVLVLDAVHPVWTAILEAVDAAGAKDSRGAWRDQTPRWNKFVAALMIWPGHLICTCMARQVTNFGAKEAGGRASMQRRSDKIQIREESVAFFDIVMALSDGGSAEVTKSRFPDSLPVGAELSVIDAGTADLMLAEAGKGIDPAEREEREQLAWVEGRIAASKWQILRDALPKAEAANRVTVAARIREALAEHDGIAPEPDPPSPPEAAPDPTPRELKPVIYPEYLAWYGSLSREDIEMLAAGSSRIGVWRQTLSVWPPASLEDWKPVCRADFISAAREAKMLPEGVK